MKVGTKVYDRWWPEQIGRVTKRLKTRLVVKWAGGVVWKYDKPHEKYLVEMK